jgi:alpha-glucosidase (family GH31 glycosyl hydrolase)
VKKIDNYPSPSSPSVAENKTPLMKKTFVFIIFSVGLIANAQTNKNFRTIKFEAAERWFGATVVDGNLMPFKEGYALDLNGNVKGNQAAPLLLSTQGRYIWSNAPFAFKINSSDIEISRSSDSLYIEKGGNTLADAFRTASKKFFPSSGKMPDTLLFTKPQYNTWIELVYDQNQEDILKYAHDIISNGFPPGVLMIDDNWFPYYGKLEFRTDRFTDPKKMISALHALGFKVMLWVCPFVSPDSEVFRDLKRKKFLLLDSKGDSTLTWEKAQEPAIINWWNGYSAVMDFTNPAAVEWYNAQLDFLTREYGVDGFKLDAGDPEYYPKGSISFRPASANDHTELWGLFGLRYPLNEYRAMWKRGGEPLAQRLRDKTHSWEDLQKLIPDITTSGLLGYAFACPDMIGGGEFSSFIGKDKLDQALIVRSAQCHALMPMMQFSVAPWRVLDSLHLAAVKKSVAIRDRFVPLILRLAEASAVNGEPIVRKMEYVFPKQDLESCNDQFMLGDAIMVAPMVKPGNSRSVIFPAGTWKADDGSTIKGPARKEITVSIDRLPWFTLVKKRK